MDYVEVLYKNKKLKGILLPNNTLKLENGYNVILKDYKIIKKKKLTINKASKIPTKYKPNNKLPKVVILGCGGTIASKVDYLTGGVNPSISVDELISSFPEIREIANIETKNVLNKLSEDISPQDYVLIAKSIYNELTKDDVKGVVVLHGTDTMHYTSAIISFMLRNLNKPVVFVGAQRSSDRPSSDNFINLICAIKIAGYADIAEVGICMHANLSDNICYFHQGTKVRKLHTSRRDTFKSINVKPLLEVNYPSLDIKYLREDHSKRVEKKVMLKEKICKNVSLIKIHPGINKKIFEEISKFSRGLILEGTGFGHVPKTILSSLKKLNIPVFMTSQTIFGRTNGNVYSRGRDLKKIGVIYLEDMLPEVALVKLMWVLGQTKDKNEVIDLMKKNISGEITRRTII